MHCFILGATGNTGRQLLDLALQRGHRVTAFVRAPQKLPLNRPGLTVIRGSPADVPSLARAMAKHDAVFSALAPNLGETFKAPGKRTWTMSGYAANIVQAMEQAKVKPLIAFSSAGLFPDQSLFVRALSFPARHHLADLKVMEEIYQASRLEWTLLRPTWMKAGESDAYRVAVGALPENSKVMHHRGLANFMLDAAENGGHPRALLGIGR